MGRWGDANKLLSKDTLCILGLSVLAIALYTSGIGDLALRDWDEGIVASVAREIWRGFPDNTWLYPTIDNGQPYWNKPPLIHWLIACSYSLFGVSEWSTRLFPALISASCVPLLYQIGRELFRSRLAAVFLALVYLTYLPIARHGRVAMLDGAINCWFCLAVWCLLRGRKDRRWLLGTGIGIGLICLTKGMMMGVLLGGILVLFLLWDSPKLLLSPYLTISFILGIIPALAWYLLQYLHYGSEFLGISFGEQTFNRIWQPVSHVSSPPWYYLLEIAKYGLPWLIFLPFGIKLAIKNYHLSWAKLALVWCGVYLLTTSLMVTKLPWYIMPIYPGLSLFVGASLAISWSKNIYPRSWQIALTVVTFVCWLGSIYLGFSGQVEKEVAIIVGLLAIAFTVAVILLWFASGYFIPVTIGGFYLVLLLFFNSNNWLWELNEAFPVRPIAAKIEQYTPVGQSVYTNYPYHRPSLKFYSDRIIVPTEDVELKRLWSQTKPVFLLVDNSTIKRLNLNDAIELGRNQEQLQLITQGER